MHIQTEIEQRSLDEERRPLLRDLETEDGNTEIISPKEDPKISVWISLTIAVLIIVTLVGMTELANWETDGKPFQTFWVASVASIFVYPVWLIHHQYFHPEDTVAHTTTHCMLQAFQNWSNFFIMIIPSTIMFSAQFTLFLMSSSRAPSSIVISIFNASAGLIYALSVFILKHKFSWVKMGAVFLCIGGVAMVSLSHQAGSGSGGSWIGLLMAGFSAVMISVYIIHFNYYIRLQHMGLICLYISGFGAVELLLLWTPILPMYYLGVENVGFPADAQGWLVASGIATCIFISNLAVWIGTPYTSPIFIAVANILAIPFSFLFDKVKELIEHKPIDISALSIAGMGLIAIGFIFINIEIDFSKFCKRKKHLNV